jgi:hypothetical protein
MFLAKNISAWLRQFVDVDDLLDHPRKWVTFAPSATPLEERWGGGAHVLSKHLLGLANRFVDVDDLLRHAGAERRDELQTLVLRCANCNCDPSCGEVHLCKALAQ